MLSTQKSGGVFQDSLRILPVPERDDSFGDVTKLHHFRNTATAFPASCRRRVRPDAWRPRGCRRRRGRLNLKRVRQFS